MAKTRKLAYLNKLSNRIKLIRKKINQTNQKSTKYDHNSIKSAEPQKKQTATQIPTFNIQTNSHQTLFQYLQSKGPVKLINYSQLSYKNPDKVHVVVSNPQKQTNQHDTIHIPYQEQKISKFQFTELPVNQFMEYNGNLQLSVVQMNLEQKTVKLPLFVYEYFTQKRRGLVRNTIEQINLWHYKGNRISDWHYDGHDNFLFITKGKKVVYLMAPNTVDEHLFVSNEFLQSKDVFNVNDNHANIDDFNQFSKHRKLMFKSQVSADQCIFIPRGWWHYVESYGQPSIAINVWGNSIRNLVSADNQQMMMKYIISEMSTRMLKGVQNYQILSQKLQTQYRRVYLTKYLKQYLSLNND